MKTYITCIPCILNQGINIAKKLNTEEFVIKEMLKEMMIYLSSADLDNSPPYLVKNISKIINKHLKTEDPYEEIKSYFNKELLNLSSSFEKKITSFNDALKLSIIGNIIDFGAKQDISKDNFMNYIFELEKKKLSIDDSNLLYKKLKNSKTLLYLGDNCGEIVFDKIFIKYIKNEFKGLKVYYAVRGKAIINDVTLKDAIEVKMEDYATIISNGSSAPGTILNEVSEEFETLFNKSDLIISKGQGNYESLSSSFRENTFFLFMAKCDLIASSLGLEKMALICKKNGRNLI